MYARNPATGSTPRENGIHIYRTGETGGKGFSSRWPTFKTLTDISFQITPLGIKFLQYYSTRRTAENYIIFEFSRVFVYISHFPPPAPLPSACIRALIFDISITNKFSFYFYVVRFELCSSTLGGGGGRHILYTKLVFISFSNYVFQ